MAEIWAWCLVFVISGQQLIVQFDYKTEDDCAQSILSVKEQHPDMQAQSWCVPIMRPESLNIGGGNDHYLSGLALAAIMCQWI